MSKVENAVRFAEQIAADNSHGYEWGGWGPDYDCGHLIIDAFERAGIPVKSAGGATYTVNMPEAFMRCGARDVTQQVNLGTGAGMQRGDVLVNRQNHAALCVGSGRIVQARSDFDGIPGDSSGQEIRVQAYYNYPWTHVLRFPEETAGQAPATSAPPQNASQSPSAGNTPRVLKKGQFGGDVKEMQELLIKAGYSVGPYGADGGFGKNTLAAVLKFQEAAGLDKDGLVGPLTMAALRKAAAEKTEHPPAQAPAPEERSYTVKSGDSLWKIARDELGDYSRFEEIRILNGLSTSWIYPGQVLKLPQQ